MKETYEKAFDFAMSWERWRADVPGDPGGFTIWGVTSKYYPAVFKILEPMTEVESKEYVKNHFYYAAFWEPSGCNDYGYPLDWMVFDTAMNTRKGARWVLAMGPDNWQDFLLLRIAYYLNNAEVKFVRGLINRCLALRKVIKHEGGS